MAFTLLTHLLAFVSGGVCFTLILVLWCLYTGRKEGPSDHKGF